MEWQKTIGFRQWVVQFAGVTTVVRVSKYELCENGDEVDFVFVPHRMHFFDCETEEAIVL